MDATLRPRIKICCIGSEEEARLAVLCGASALGFVSHMPSGPGVISEELIARIVPVVPPGVATFLLTSAQTAEEIVAQQRRTRVNTIQLCDSLDVPDYAAMRDAMPGISLVQVIHVTGEASIREAVEVAPHVDAILLDSGNPALAVKELGGTGRRHDWSISRRIREAVGAPVYLAGGLRPDNVREAIAQVGPFGLDVCSGVRSNGRLDERKLRAFLVGCTTDGG
ncbi:MAG TPA: phosphoribosylanthranilate isomerase [Armatimonadota bacterium]|jgi:phosphoribosylanthranilate isomerase